VSADPDTGPEIEADAEGEVEIDTNTDADIDVRTADTMRERSNESRLKLWVVLGANRLLITGLIALAFFAGFVVIGELFIPTFESTLRSDDN
jgi:hypothetical protein